MKTPIDFMCYEYTYPEGRCTLFQFYPNGEWDEDKLTLNEALERYPIGHYEWIHSESYTHGISKDAQDYVNNCGAYCPACRTTQITGGTIDIDGTEAFQEVSCNNCGASWNDLYRLVGFDDLETG